MRQLTFQANSSHLTASYKVLKPVCHIVYKTDKNNNA